MDDWGYPYGKPPRYPQITRNRQESLPFKARRKTDTQSVAQAAGPANGKHFSGYLWGNSCFFSLE